jgi:hypothetical protein
MINDFETVNTEFAKAAANHKRIVKQINNISEDYMLKHKHKFINTEGEFAFDKKAFTGSNWHFFKTKELSNKFFSEFYPYLSKQDWEHISKFHKITKGFIRKYEDKINVYVLSRNRKLSMSIIDDYINDPRFFTEDLLCTHCNNPEFMEKYAQKFMDEFTEDSVLDPSDAEMQFLSMINGTCFSIMYCYMNGLNYHCLLDMKELHLEDNTKYADFFHGVCKFSKYDEFMAWLKQMIEKL